MALSDLHTLTAVTLIRGYTTPRQAQQSHCLHLTPHPPEQKHAQGKLQVNNAQNLKKGKKKRERKPQTHTKKRGQKKPQAPNPNNPNLNTCIEQQKSSQKQSLRVCSHSPASIDTQVGILGSKVELAMKGEPAKVVLSLHLCHGAA